MGLVPHDRLGKISFYKGKIAAWTASATQIGTTTAAVSALDALVDAAEAAVASQVVALAAAKSATENADLAIATMANSGADIISSVRTKARTAGDSVYVLAQIPAPATPSPVGPPGIPEALKVELNPDGSIKLTWRCPNPVGSVGTLYHVFRSVGNPDEYAFIGGTGAREFTDSSVPSGSSVVYYKIQGIRTTAMGVAGEFMVRFGVGGSVEVTAMTPAEPKLAA